MADKVIVVVSDENDARRGEVTVVDNPRTATHLVETLLEAGYQPERIRLFNGDQAAIQVTQRPVVAMVGDESTPIGAASPATDEAPRAPQARAASQAGEEEATPFMKNGVRFSSLFRTG